MAIKQFEIELVNAEMITDAVRHLAFKRVDGEEFPFIPGQFVTLLLPTPEKLLRRSYSIASLNQADNLIEFAASYVNDGVATALLFNLQPGDKITCSGPFGRLVLRDEDVKRYVLVATGTGITPYRSMLSEIAQRVVQQEVQVVILQGVRRQADLLYGDDFLQCAKAQPGVEFIACYSRETASALKPYERAGRVTAYLANLALDPARDVVYLCGNPEMIDESFAYLQQLDFPKQNIRREKYISTN